MPYACCDRLLSGWVCSTSIEEFALRHHVLEARRRCRLATWHVIHIRKDAGIMSNAFAEAGTDTTGDQALLGDML